MSEVAAPTALDARPLGLSKTAGFALLALFSIGVPRVTLQSSATTLFLSYHSAATLAYVYLSVAMLIPLAVAGFLAVERRVSTAKLLIGLEAGRALAALGLQAALTSPYAGALSFAAVIWVETEFVLGSLVCWGLAGQCFAVSETRKAYPRIAAGEQTGALVAGAAIPFLMQVIAPASLLWISAGSLFVSTFLITRIAATHLAEAARPAAGRPAARSVRPPPFNRLMRTYALAIMAAALFANVGFFLVDNLFYRTVEQGFSDQKAMASFLGVTFSAASAVTLLLSLTLAPRLLTRFGIGTAIAWLPGALLLLGAAVIGFDLLGLGNTVVVFAAVTAMKLTDEGFRVAFYRPAFQGLYQPIPPKGRVKAQARTEGIAEPAGIALAGIIVLVLGQSQSGAPLLAAIAMLGFAGWFIVTRLLRRLHIGALGLAAARRQNIDMTGGGLDGPEARRLLVETLRSGDEASMIAAADLLARSNRKLFLAAAPGLMRSGGEKLLALILDALRPSELAQLFPVLRDRLWREKQPALRARILSAIGHLGEPRVTAVLAAATYAEGPEREAAYAGMLRAGRGVAGEQAEAELRAFAASGDVFARRLFLGAVAQSGSPRFDAEVAKLFGDPDGSTQRLALSVAGRSGRGRFIGALARRLEGEAGDAAARALAALGGQAMGRLATALEGSKSRRVRVLAAGALGRIGSPAAQAHLAAQIFHRDIDTAGAVAAALARCGGRLEGNLAPRTFERVELLLGHAAEMIQAEADAVGLADAALLLPALRHRASDLIAQAFVLAALQRGKGGVDVAPLVSGRLRSEQQLFVAELVDGLMPVRLRPFCAALGEAPEARLPRLQALGRTRPMPVQGRLAGLASDAWGGDWLRACALRTASTLDREGAAPLLAELAEEKGLVGETAKRLLERDGSGEDAMSLSTIEKVLILKRSDLFGFVPDNTLASFAPMMESTYFGTGETVMREGEVSDRLYTVVSGQLEVTRGHGFVATLGPNDVLGDLAALDPQPSADTVTAVTECHLLVLTSDHLETLISSHPDISFGIIKVLCRRLQRAQGQAASLGLAEQAGL